MQVSIGNFVDDQYGLELFALYEFMKFITDALNHDRLGHPFHGSAQGVKKLAVKGSLFISKNIRYVMPPPKISHRSYCHIHLW
jgi:hypothetical protein